MERSGQLSWRFVERDGRGLDVHLGEAWPGFNEALADSVSSMPHRGEATSGLSTYWVDRLLAQLAADLPDGTALTYGNSTEIVLDGRHVIARSLYETFDDERVTLEELRDLLVAWREAICASANRFEIAHTYRRNPFDGHSTRRDG